MFDPIAGKKLLLDLANVLESLHIKFFLIQGTALGAYRDKGFVATERDIDLGVLIENFAHRTGDIVKALVDKNIEVETWHRHSPFKFCHTIVAYIKGAKADIVGFHKYKDKRFTCTPDDPVNVLEPYALVHDAVLLEQYQPVELFDRTFNVPCPIEDYLLCEYGLNWKTPAEDHISRTRIYNYVADLPNEYLNTEHRPNWRTA